MHSQYNTYQQILLLKINTLNITNSIKNLLIDLKP